MSASAAIEVRGLRRAFGPTVALRGVDLTVPEGGFHVLLGPNGAGKTTLLRILATLLRPSGGSFRLWGRDGADPALRSELGFISHQLYLYPQLTARENLRFFGRLYELTDLDARVDAALAEVELSAAADREVATFSRGMQQRVSIARALLHRPSIVLLDEPYTGLDPHAAGVLTGLLRGLVDGHRAFVLVTHDLHQARALGQTASILARGRVVAELDLTSLPADALVARYAEVVDRALGAR